MTFSSPFELSELNGANGFVINGVDSSDFLGSSVSSAGDVNGDGIDDLIIGASNADPNDNSSAGESYIVFGSDSAFAANLELSGLDGTNGFVINGIDSEDLSGTSVSSAGDINDDGFDDLIIGAEFANPNDTFNAGESYVVFGSGSPFAASLELSGLDGNTGFVINGVDSDDLSGTSVSSAGDINNDGFDDLIIGATGADPNDNSSAGESYVVFGSGSPFAANFELSSLDGTNGFTINGIDSDDLLGTSVSSAGDINNDGFDDLIIGAEFADSNGDDSGESYVVFGSGSPFAASIELSSLDGTNGFVINGVGNFDFSGTSVSSAGDVNDDGIDDLIIGASSADPNGNFDAGESYVVFGSESAFPASLELSEINEASGFVINGVDSFDFSGTSVSGAGDVNGDGIDDLILGATGADPNGNSSAGESYVVFGGIPQIREIDSITIDENTTFVTDIEATDNQDSEGSGLTYSFAGGDDAALFNIDSNTGELSFIAAPDFENPLDQGADNNYQVQVQVTDSGDLSDTQDLTISVQNAAESPEITTVDPVSIAENTTFVVDIAATDDADSEGSGLTYSLAGGDDAALFNIDSNTGELSFIAAPNFENPLDQGADNNYQVQVQVTDSGDLSDTQDLTISVQNEAPTLDALSINLNRFQNSDRPGTFFFADEAESILVRENFPQFVEEGVAFGVANQAGEELEEIFRFQSVANQGTFLFVGAEERESILNNFSEDFVEEGSAFFVLPATSEVGTTIFRFQNTDQPGTFLFANAEERTSILANFPQFVEEGAAFNVAI